MEKAHNWDEIAITAGETFDEAKHQRFGNLLPLSLKQKRCKPVEFQKESGKTLKSIQGSTNKTKSGF